MEDLITEVLDLEGVKAVKRQSGPVLKIELFSREIKGSEAEEISGDLRKISQNLRNTLDRSKKRGEFKSWEWIVKPEKQYQETKLGRKKLSDRKGKGHKPSYYRVSVQE